MKTLGEVGDYPTTMRSGHLAPFMMKGLDCVNSGMPSFSRGWPGMDNSTITSLPLDFPEPVFTLSPVLSAASSPPPNTPVTEK